MNTLTVPINERDHLRGSPDAPVVLVEYADFECPYCGAAYGVVKNLERELPDTLAVVFRQFPLVNVHPHAQLAAEAAEAAGAQGQFWRMHDVLFEHQDALAPADLIKYAAALHLDVKRFAGDLSGHAFLPKIEDDMEGGLQSGVQGTPTFFINGVLHRGGHDEASLLAAIMRVAAAAS
ncbi:thioredoxin domain-containing protein [Ramlibacter ginsenosidimutans]|uniref:Thioredoxin domain-containing protein n=1 Tax=Ramlibacter ginsenosidimutans TaxID=502333 RepID=A0A934WN00_9BURK|nr:thioredoxin domain-containing protein [Ramlibacter ginsenosidimutans]MBK6007145.1 thioredoxin domain-containing protein [Ramlibacter ginsenosidimutans]